MNFLSPILVFLRRILALPEPPEFHPTPEFTAMPSNHLNQISNDALDDSFELLLDGNISEEYPLNSFDPSFQLLIENEELHKRGLNPFDSSFQLLLNKEPQTSF